MAHADVIVTTTQYNKHITGSTRRITTDVVAGWCGVDIAERVTFDLNTAGTLLIDIEGRKYKLRNVKKSNLIDTLRIFLSLPRKMIEEHAVKDRPAPLPMD